MNRIAIVSNRLPPLDREETSAGGLAVGISAALAKSGGTWLGWNGEVSSGQDRDPRVHQTDPYTVVSLPLSSDGIVSLRGRQFRAGVFPIEIDTRSFAELAASKEAGVLRDRLRGCFNGQLGMIGVDRLDYTKGVDYRLRAFERLLETAPPQSRQAFLLQIAAPSRETIPEDAELRGELESLSGRINARHARIDWMPVRYINRAYSQTRLAALYRLSRVGLVTPLRDGMNLVAKEYVAAQHPDNPGVLVLSRFAGAAHGHRSERSGIYACWIHDPIGGQDGEVPMLNVNLSFVRGAPRFEYVHWF